MTAWSKPTRERLPDKLGGVRSGMYGPAGRLPEFLLSAQHELRHLTAAAGGAGDVLQA
jgi:hypothetical protein